MPKVHIVQLLCPERHCIATVAYEEGSMPPAEVEQRIEDRIKQFGASRQCGLCGSTDLKFEHAPTRFGSMEEAMPAIAAEAAKNTITRAVADAAGVSHEARREQAQRN